MKIEWWTLFAREPRGREKILFWITIGFFVVFVLGGGAVIRSTEKAALRAEFESLAIEERNYRKLSELAQKAVRAAPALSGLSFTLDEVFSRLEKSPVDYSDFQEDEAFEWLVSPEMRAGAKLLSLERGVEDGRERYVAIPISLRMQGHPRQMVLYLEALEGLPQLFSIESLRVSQSPQGKSAVEWALKLWLYFGKQTNKQAPS